MKFKSRTWYAVMAMAFFVAIDHVSDLFHLLNLRRFMHWQLVLAIRNLVEVSLSMIGVAVAGRSGLRRMARELGMTAPVGRGLAFALMASAPMLIVFAVGFHFNHEMTLLGIVALCFISPFAEEVLFRGYLFRQLYQRAGMGFWVSALIPSVLFALGHAYQSSKPLELLGIFAIAGLGSILLCWIYKQWRYNLWAIVGLHVMMNLWWEVFAVDDTALGGWLANGARLATIVCAILLTKFNDRLWSPLPEPVDAPAAGRTPSSLDEKAAAVPGNPIYI